MPFLIPAVVASLSDVLILVLQEHREENQFLIDTTNSGNNGYTTEDTDDDSLLAVHQVQYLGFAAVLRLILLLFPLPYHSYTGTAIRCSFCYQLFYGATVFVVLVHMLALSMIDPDSIATIVSTTATTNDTTTPATLQTLHQQLSRSCWWILLLSLVAVMAHIVMLIHVRSTAPSLEYMPYPALATYRKKKMVYYYASKHSHPPHQNYIPTNHEHPLPTHNNPPPTPPINPPSHTCPTSPIQKLSSQYDDFVNEIQTRISHLKQDWTHKLDDFTQRHLNSTGQLVHNATHRIIGAASHNNNPLLPLTPFRVLLQLFAYQDVIDSGKLDAVFDMDQGQSLTFFVPQLLSFLLHGAYYEADPTKLEAWILDKCAHHIHFAHRCYWFLRAWSLEQDYDHYEQQQQLTPNPSSLLSLQGTPHKQPPALLAKSGSQSSLLISTTNNTNGSKIHSRTNSGSSLAAGIHSPKLLPEERAVVETLMLRVVQAGEASARILQYGPTTLHATMHPSASTTTTTTTTKKRRGQRDKVGVPQPPTRSMSEPTPKQPPPQLTPQEWFWEDSGEQQHHKHQPAESDGDIIQRTPSYTLVPALALTPEKEAFLPIDPNTGFPSQRHLETLTASHRFGFLPWSVAKKQQQLLQATGASATAGSETTCSSTTDSFPGTPRFLDALLAIADGLFLVPKEQRKDKLRQQLQSLEVEMLPSNVVYVPISNNIHHRVWRIVADESIALNTKERVPCIVLLEVVDYDNNIQATLESNDAEDADDLSGGGMALDLSGDSTRTKQKQPLELLKLEMPKLSMTKKPARTKVAGEKCNTSRDYSHGLDVPFSIPYYTLMGGMSEMEIVNHWRFAKRDPHRGESILGKMTSSLPLDMIRMKEKIHQLRDKQSGIFHDLLAMAQPEDVDLDLENRGSNDGLDSNYRKTTTVAKSRDLDSEIATFLRNDVYEGSRILPINNTDAKNDDTGNNRDISPERNHVHVSMGQWSSPVADRSRVMIRIPVDDRNVETSAQKVSYVRQDSSDYYYGSTYEGRGQTSNVMDGRPPLQPVEVGASKGVTPRISSNQKPPQQVVFRENWQAKEERLRPKSAFGDHPGWRLLPILVKANDDLRQEQLASQLIQRMAIILARERVPVWLCPYEIIAITDTGGIIEAIPDTISLDSLKRNDPNFVDLKTFFHSHFGGNLDDLADAKSNFVESLAAYSIVTFLLQIKDRHNGNILLDNRGHLIHIDFGFFFLSSPGKNSGFESAPFKLTRDFVEVLGGPESHSFRIFRELCVRSFLVLRRHSMEIILLVEMLRAGNENLPCFLGRPDDAIKGLRERFRLDLSDRACKEYVNSLIDESLENWRTNWYDRYQKYCVGVL